MLETSVKHILNIVSANVRCRRRFVTLCLRVSIAVQAWAHEQQELGRTKEALTIVHEIDRDKTKKL